MTTLAAMVTNEYPLRDKAEIEAEARALGYPPDDLCPCLDCGGTAYCWSKFDPRTRSREPCITCGARGWVPRIYRWAFLGRATTYSEFLAHSKFLAQKDFA